MTERPQDYDATSLAGDSESCAKPQFPPVVRAADILKEVTRDKWQVGKNPWVTRGNDHE